MVKPFVISLFAGTGGSSLGYQLAGFRELLAIDFDAHAVECFKKNFPDVPVWHKSIVEVTGAEIMKFCKLDFGELDVLDGSPPCQGFSTAGKRKVTDERNDLFKQFCRLVDELAPKVFVMENVSGMIKGTMKGKFNQILEHLRSMNYEVTAKLMNAKYYDVPQSRQRIIFIGVRKDLGKRPSFPKVSSKFVSVREALREVTDVGPYPEIKNAFILSIMHKWKAGEAASKHHPKNSLFNAKRIYYLKPSQTITKMIPVGGFVHPLEDRHLSINEVKALCTFPQSWELGSDFKEAWARLGNAVMPKFMKAIAENIKQETLGIK